MVCGVPPNAKKKKNYKQNFADCPCKKVTKTFLNLLSFCASSFCVCERKNHFGQQISYGEGKPPCTRTKGTRVAFTFPGSQHENQKVAQIPTLVLEMADEMD
jgi:hypothetical protein